MFDNDTELLVAIFQKYFAWRKGLMRWTIVVR